MKESALVLLFLSLKVREAMRFTAKTYRNVRVLEMQNLIPAYTNGWTYASRTIFSEPKFLGCIDSRIFLPMVLLYVPFAHASSLLKQLACPLACPLSDKRKIHKCDYPSKYSNKDGYTWSNPVPVLPCCLEQGQKSIGTPQGSGCW